MTAIDIIKKCGSCCEGFEEGEVDCFFNKYDDNPVTIFLSSGQTINKLMHSGCNIVFKSNQFDLSNVAIDFSAGIDKMITINACDIVAVCGKQIMHTIRETEER